MMVDPTHEEIEQLIEKASVHLLNSPEVTMYDTHPDVIIRELRDALRALSKPATASEQP